MNSHAAQDKPSAQELADLRARADAGEASAQFNLGWMYYLGWGVPQDDAEAAAWYRRSAEQGHADAQFYLFVKLLERFPTREIGDRVV